MFKRIIYRIRKLFDFIKLGWEDCDWDYYYFYKLDRYKLIKAADDIEKNDPFEGSEFVVRDMRLCVKLIDIILEEDSCAEINEKTKQLELTKYVNTKNEKRFGVSVFHSNDAMVKSDVLKVAMADHLRQKKATYLYYKIRRDQTFHWWY